MELFTATGKLKKLQVPLISSDYTENWPEPVQRHLQWLMGDHVVSACTDTQRHKCDYDEKQLSGEKI
jgi:hypothetical protein